MPIAATQRLAFATSAELPSIQADDAEMATLMENSGITPVSCIWTDPAVDWATFDAVLIRTIWDYFKHHADFLHWLDRLDQLGVPTINDSALLRWNSDKRYLLELADRGVEIIPTRLAAHAELAAMLATMPSQAVVIKPTVSGGAWHTVRGTVGDVGFDEAVTHLPPEHDYLVQPFVPKIVDDGEWSLLFFGGQFSHAVIKRPVVGDFRVQSEFGGSVTAAAPDPQTLAAARQALAAAAAIGHGTPAYARVDGVVCGERFLLMELELIEPFLFLKSQPGAAEAFARSLVERLPSPTSPQPSSVR